MSLESTGEGDPGEGTVEMSLEEKVQMVNHRLIWVSCVFGEEIL